MKNEEKESNDRDRTELGQWGGLNLLLWYIQSDWSLVHLQEKPLFFSFSPSFFFIYTNGSHSTSAKHGLICFTPAVPETKHLCLGKSKHLVEVR